MHGPLVHPLNSLAAQFEMDSQHQTSNNQDNSQPFRGDYPFHAASPEQYNYLAQDNENSFSNIWDTGRYTPDSQDPINAFNQTPQHWGHGPLQTPNYGAHNYSAMQRPYDQTFSLRPETFDMNPTFGSHSHQNPPTSTFESRSNPYIQVPPNTTSQFNYSDPRVYQGASTQSQTISPQALQHYPTSSLAQKARQVSLSGSFKNKRSKNSNAILTFVIDTTSANASYISHPRACR